MIRILKLVLLLLLLAATSFSQSKPAGPIMPTPNAAGLGLYGEVPVSYFTGLPNIEVPIYTIKERELEFPLVLSYHAQGFRPDIHPSWVGLNWNLRFGGVITRRLNMYPDEWKNNDFRYFGYYYNYPRLNNNNWSSSDTLLSLANPPEQMLVDREPDVFDFNFPGFSGSFFLDHRGKWRVQCSKNIKVVLDEADIINPYFNNDLSANFSPKAIHKFTLIDDAGIKYIFGSSSASTAAIEYSSSITPPNLDYRTWLIATSWYLQKIELPGNTGYINITYERGPFQSNFQYFEAQNRFYTEPCTPGASDASNFYAKGLTGNITSPVYPTGISTSSGINVDFKFSRSNELSYSSSTYMEPLRSPDNDLPSSIPPQYFAFLNAAHYAPYYAANSIFPSGVNNACFIWFKLDSLVISTYDITNASAKTVFRRAVFNYIENTSERLKLASLNIKGNYSAGADDQLYSFTYNNISSTMNYLANLSDHWGFANNRYLERNGNGWYYWLPSGVQMLRRPSEYECSMGMLTGIKYPTGGSTQFEYELNKYGAYVLDNRQFAAPGSGEAGGLRIKRITNIDNTGKLTAKDFYYVVGYNNVTPLSQLRSSGVLERIPRYDFSVNTGFSSLYIYSSNSILPMSSNSGIFCSYSEVVEKYQDNSYKIVKFTNHDNGYTDQAPVNNITPTEMGYPVRSRDFERGQVLSETLFFANNNPVQKTEYTYTRIGETADTNFARSYRKAFGGYCIDLNVSNPQNIQLIMTTQGFQELTYMGTAMSPHSFVPRYSTATAYGHYAYKFVKEKIKQTNYSSNSSVSNSIINETTYQYDQWGNILSETGTNSNGNVITKNYKYPYHFAGTGVYNEMINRNMTGYVIESNKYDGANFVESEKVDYALFNSSALVKPRYIIKKNGAGSPYTTDYFNVYDNNGNIREWQGPDGITKSYVWGYFNSRPMAMVIGTDYATVQPVINYTILNNPTNETQLATEIDKLRTSLPAAFVTTCLYDPFTGWNVKKIKDLNGRSIYYEYDKLGRLSVVKNNDLDVLSKNEYIYRQELVYPFRNVEESRIIQPTTVSCDPGYTYNGVMYRVPADKYGSFINQTDAQQKAIAEIDQYGLAYANANAICYPYYSYTPCCLWGSPFSNFSLAAGNTIDFSIVLFKTSGATNWTIENQVGNLSGLLFVPSADRTVSVTADGRTWNVKFKSSGAVTIFLVSGTPPGSSSSIQLAGNYSK